MKRCKKCGELKPLSEFYRAAGMRDGHRNDCKVCNLAEKKRRYDADPAAAVARVKKWQQENADRLNAYRRKRREDPAVKRAARVSHLKRKYGITIEQYEAMLALQGGGCAICRRRPPEGTSLHVDHDHETSEIRGLLCFPCNNFLGDVEEDIRRLKAAADYLERGMEEPELEWAIREGVAELKVMARRS